MRQSVRLSLLLLSYAALFLSPAFGAHRRVVGVVTEADRGRLDSQGAKVGADIYSCDSLDTNDGGDLRARVGLSQLYLTALGSAQIEDDGLTFQILAEGGTVEFSEPSTANISVRTPAGVIRAEGAMAVAGEVTYKSTTELVITAIRGNLTLDNGGELRTIPEGKSADVTFQDPLSVGCHEAAGADENLGPRKIGFIYIIPPALAIPSYILWEERSESNSTPRK